MNHENLKSNWIAKKNRNLFKYYINGKLKKAPCFYVADVYERDSLILIDGNGGSLTSNSNPLNDFEIISSFWEAKNLLETYEDCKKLDETLGGNHLREDGQEKVGFEDDKFGASLYNLKMKEPDYHCSAYRCETCGKIHIGKGARKV